MVFNITPDLDKEELVLRDLSLSRDDLLSQVAELRSWYQAQPYLPQYLGTKELTVFVVQSKGRPAKAQAKLDAYFTGRSIKSYLFIDRDPVSEDILRVTDSMKLGVLPCLTPDGARIVFVKPVGDGTQFNFPNWCRKYFMLLDLLVKYDQTNSGILIVTDLQQFTLQHMLKLDPLTLRDCIHTQFKIVPYRYRGTICFNSAPMHDLLFNKVIKPLCPKKMAERIHVYSAGASAVASHIPQELLPEDYGGIMPSVDRLEDLTSSELSKKRRWLMSKGQVTIKEELRPKGEPQNCNVM